MSRFGPYRQKLAMLNDDVPLTSVTKTRSHNCIVIDTRSVAPSLLVASNFG
jgi:hypothetical protein